MSKIDQLLDRASDKFMAADILANHECFDDAISRTFYGLLYCARALLPTKSLSLQDPDEVISAFRNEFVKKGIVDSELGTLLKETKPLAGKADFSPSFKISRTNLNRISSLSTIRQFSSRHTAIIIDSFLFLLSLE